MGTSKMEPKWSPMESKWSPNGAQMESNWCFLLYVFCLTLFLMFLKGATTISSVIDLRCVLTGVLILRFSLSCSLSEVCVDMAVFVVRSVY